MKEKISYEKLDIFLLENIKIDGLKVYKNEPSKDATYPYILFGYEVVQNEGYKVKLDLTVQAWSNESSVEVVDITEKFNLLFDKTLYYSEKQNYRIYQKQPTVIDTDEKLWTKGLEFEVIII